MLKRLDMIIIYITNMERSHEWYQEVLGLTPLSQHGDFATLQVGDSRIGLHGGANTEPDLLNAGSMPVFQVEDYQQAKSALQSKGVQFVFENSTPTAAFGTMLDPDGNPLQIMQRL